MQKSGRTCVKTTRARSLKLLCEYWCQHRGLSVNLRGEGSPGSPHLGPATAATPQGRGRLSWQLRPFPPSRDAPDACGVRGDTGRSCGCCGKWPVQEAGTPRAALRSRFPALLMRRLPSPNPGEWKRILRRCGRRPPLAALAGPAGKAVEVSAALLGGARGRRALRLPPGAGLGSRSRALELQPLQCPLFLGLGWWWGRGQDEGLGLSAPHYRNDLVAAAAGIDEGRKSVADLRKGPQGALPWEAGG